MFIGGYQGKEGEAKKIVGEKKKDCTGSSMVVVLYCEWSNEGVD